MTIEQFDKIIGYLMTIVLPPNVSDDDPVQVELVLAVLERRCEELRGIIIRAANE